MNTRDFVAYYKKLRKKNSDKKDISNEEARKEIEDFFDLIGDIVAMDEEIKFKNKGIFSLKKGMRRKIGNPQTKEVEEIDTKNSIKFIQSKSLEKY